MPKKSSPGNSGAGARFPELRLEVVLEAIATEGELEELEELGYEEEMGYEGAVGEVEVAVQFCHQLLPCSCLESVGE